MKGMDIYILIKLTNFLSKTKNMVNAGVKSWGNKGRFVSMRPKNELGGNRH